MNSSFGGESRRRAPRHVSLKDVGRVELAPPFFDISSDVDGHPATAIVLKPLPGWSAAIAIEAIEKDLEELKAAAFPPGMNFEVIPLDSRDMIYAVDRDSSRTRRSNTRAPGATSWVRSPGASTGSPRSPRWRVTRSGRRATAWPQGPVSSI